MTKEKIIENEAERKDSPFLYKPNMPLLEYGTWPFSCVYSKDRNNQRKSVRETTFMRNFA